MTEQQLPAFSQEEQLEQAAGIISGLYFGFIAYLREQGLSPEHYLQWQGERFAPGWEEVRGDLEQITYYTALNLVASGNELVGYEVGEDESTIRLDMVSHLQDGVSPEDVDLFAHIHAPTTDYLDLDLTMDREGDIATIHMRRRQGS